MDLVLNNVQRLICHKTQQTKPSKIPKRSKKNYKKSFTYCNTHKKGKEVSTYTFQLHKGSHM